MSQTHRLVWLMFYLETERFQLKKAQVTGTCHYAFSAGASMRTELELEEPAAAGADSRAPAWAPRWPCGQPPGVPALGGQQWHAYGHRLGLTECVHPRQLCQTTAGTDVLIEINKDKKIYYTTYTEPESNVGRAAQGEQRPRPINSRWRGEKRDEEAANEAEGDPRAVTASSVRMSAC